MRSSHSAVRFLLGKSNLKLLSCEEGPDNAARAPMGIPATPWICMRKSSEPSHPDPGLRLHDQAGTVPALELPDAPDFVSRRTPMTLAQFLPLLEENRKSLSSAALHASRHRPVSAEFIL